MSVFRVATQLVLLIWSMSALADDHHAEIAKIKSSLLDPDAFLKKAGPLVIMGNAPIDKAKIIILPEIHDDPTSLMAQLAFIAREKRRNRSFVVLDESLSSLKKSMWDIFSQKTMEILAARDQRRGRQNYVPQEFEQALQNLATKFRSSYGQLNQAHDTGLWTLDEFADVSTPFFGWDSLNKSTLAERNGQMVASLKKLANNSDRILVMAGARHVPELEYMTSKRLLCAESKFNDMDKFFSVVENRFGEVPNLRYGVGATAPIHKYLNSQQYAIVFTRDLYNELDRIVDQFKSRLGSRGCMNLGQ